MKALDLGYDILLEKPIAQTDEECRRLVAYAKEKGKIVGLTHVLRYSPYFGMLKEMVSSKAIGDLVSIQHFEPIEHVHMSHSYVRGSWRNAEASTPLVLAKSSHDLDILHWIIGKPCKKVVAFGDLAHFKAENAPEGAPARCTDGWSGRSDLPFLRPENLLPRPHLAIRIRPAGRPVQTGRRHPRKPENRTVWQMRLPLREQPARSLYDADGI